MVALLCPIVDWSSFPAHRQTERKVSKRKGVTFVKVTLLGNYDKQRMLIEA